MGEVVWPTSGTIYLDANCFIYSVERIDPYRSILDTLWQAVSKGQVTVVTSELTLLEVLVKPQVGDETVAAIYRAVLHSYPDVQMLPINQAVLEEAAQQRVTTGLKTPDALHTATALLNTCSLFMTNDAAFRRVSNLKMMLLSEIVLEDKTNHITQ
jgi:predicted nucleic acid-binding protein